MAEAAEYVLSKVSRRPKVGIVLGSGLGEFADYVDDGLRLPYSDLPGFPIATAAGHRGELVLGMVGAIPVALMAGRFHLYEGYSPQQVASGIRLFKDLGIARVLLTNAAGGLNSTFAPGSLVIITDHINLQGANPLVGRNGETVGCRFPDMTDAYASELRRIAKQTAVELGIRLQEGVYAAVLGPSYETPAEIRYLKTIGADLVGMSTVVETIAANQLGMEVLGISCVTNLAAGLSGKKLNHAEVLATGARMTNTLIRLLSALTPRLA
jgi:purine-nucleoside phosphorylase